MIVIDKQDLLGGARDAAGPGWTSLRLLVKSDGMGFSMTETKVMPGTVLDLEYKNHIEACYCISGRGRIVETATGAEHVITPGVLYAPDAHDAHQVIVEGDTPFHLICVFSPALRGGRSMGRTGVTPAGDPA